MSSRDSTLSTAEQQVVDSVMHLVAQCPVGFDGPVLDAIRDSLLEEVDHDSLAITVEDEGRDSYRLLWRSTVSGAEEPVPIAIGERRQYSSAHGRFDEAETPTKWRPRIVEDARASDVPLARAAAKAGALSYVMVPLIHAEERVGWLVVSHRVPGAPSQASMALLFALCRAIAPAIVRARTAERSQVLSALLDGCPDGMVGIDASGAVIEANQRAFELLDLPRTKVVGRPLRALVDEPTFARLLLVLLREVRSEQPPIEIDLRGTPVDVSVTRLSRMPDGCLLVCLRDARARQAARETAARRIEHSAFLRALGEAMAGAVRADAALRRAVDICFVRFELGTLCGLRADPDGAMRLVAEHGASPGLATLLDCVTDDQMLALFGEPATFSTLKRVLEAAKRRLPGDADDAGGRWIMFVPLFHARRRLGGLLLAGHADDAAPPPDLRETWEPIAHTISVALRSAGDFERVVALEAEKRQLVDSLPVIVARLDPATGVASFVNAALYRVLGVRAGELGALGMDALLADDLEREASRFARARAAAGVATGWQDRRYRHADGRMLTLRESIYPVQGPAENVQAVELIAYDITTELTARKQLMQSDRLASLGVLASGVAHEINNPVAFLGLATRQMKRLIDDTRTGESERSNRLRETIDDVVDAAAHIAEIVGELKLFTRIPEGASACPVDVNRMLQTALTLTSAEVKRHARLEVQLEPLPLAPGAFSTLGHVFANLLVNAAQAIESKHALGPGSTGDFVRVSSVFQDGIVLVRVSDTGIGIEGDMLPRIFDPFFKARSGGQGSGLGLAIAYDLVRRVGGDIRVSSTPGSGTTFDVVLPLKPPAVATDPPVSARPDPDPPASEERSAPPLRRVLIIDDERPLVKALARQLAERYEVDTALTATDALAQLRVNVYDAVVCDLRLPEKSGPSIYDEVVARSPEQASRFIFTTGGTYGAFDDEPQARAEATGLPLLEKPFDGASFEEAVERVASKSWTRFRAQVSP